MWIRLMAESWLLYGFKIILLGSPYLCYITFKFKASGNILLSVSRNCFCSCVFYKVPKIICWVDVLECLWFFCSFYILLCIELRGSAGARCSSVVREFAHGAMGCRIDPLSYFSFQPVLHDWRNKGMYYPVCGMMHIKEPLLLIGKSILCGRSGFPLLLSEWSFTICLTSFNRK